MLDFKTNLDFIRHSRRLCGGENVTFCCDRKVPKNAQRGLKRVQVWTSAPFGLPPPQKFLAGKSGGCCPAWLLFLALWFSKHFCIKIALPEFFTPAGRSVIIVLCSQKVRLLPYLLPLSYGIPSAFGARDLLLVSASTRSEMMYGSML